MKLKLSISILRLFRLFTTWKEPACIINSIPKTDIQELESCLWVPLVVEAAAPKFMMASGKAGGARATVWPAKFISPKEHLPLPRPGIWVHGDPPDGGTGPLWRDWIFPTIFSDHRSPSNGLAANTCWEHDPRTMVTKIITVKYWFLLWEPICEIREDRLKTKTTTMLWYV